MGTENETTREERMETYARQTADAARNIQSAMLLLLAIVIVAAAVGLAVWVQN